MIDFLQILPTGKQKAISAERLREKIGATDARQVRLMVSKARLSGQLICSGREGYYLPANDSEVRAFIDRTEQQAISLLSTLKTARNTLKYKGKQCTPFEETELYAFFRDVIEDKTEETQNADQQAQTEEKTAPPRDALGALREKLQTAKG